MRIKPFLKTISLNSILILLLSNFLIAAHIHAANAEMGLCGNLLNFIGAKRPINQLFWLDLETGGLDENRQPIIEVGSIITDSSLNEVARFREVVYQPSETIQAFDPMALEMHQKSGLIHELSAGKPLAVVEQTLVDFIQRHYKQGEEVILAGNSVHFDRAFIRRHMPAVYRLLFYRQLDVSSLKIVTQMVHGIEPAKPMPHFALEDLELSIRELKTYLALMHDQRIRHVLMQATSPALKDSK